MIQKDGFALDASGHVSPMNRVSLVLVVEDKCIQARLSSIQANERVVVVRSIVQFAATTANDSL